MFPIASAFSNLAGKVTTKAWVKLQDFINKITQDHFFCVVAYGMKLAFAVQWPRQMD